MQAIVATLLGELYNFFADVFFKDRCLEPFEMQVYNVFSTSNYRFTH